MPTKRLSDNDRNALLSRIVQLVELPHRTYLLDLTRKEQAELVTSTVLPEVFAAAQLLCSHRQDVVRMTYRPRLLVYEEPPEATLLVQPKWFAVSLRLEDQVPDVSYRVTDLTLPHASEVLEWAKAVDTLTKRAHKAHRYADDAVNRCSSIGQIKRVLPGLEEFAPVVVAKSLINAERRSRIPQGFEVDDAQRLNLMEMLAMGSLCKPLSYADRANEAEVTGAYEA